MKHAVVFVASLASLLSLWSLGEGTQATKETKGTEQVGSRPVATESGKPTSVSDESGGPALRAGHDESGRAVAPRPPQPARRARPPRERRREGNIPGIVTIPYGKTASGERTHIYRIMGQGGVVADFTDYGARLVRLYAPDATGDLKNILEGFKPSVIECEKAGELADVWQMTPIRRPRATGLVFEQVGRAVPGEPQVTKATQETQATNKVASVPSSRVTYWLDADNTLTVESSIADTNAVKWASTLRLAPFANRPFTVKTPDASLSFTTTTNVTEISLRPLTNTLQRAEFNFKGIKKL